MKSVNTAAIPADLRALPRWVCWHLAYRDGKPTKVPVDAKTGRPASSTDQSTWSDFETAQAAVSRFKCNGVGLCMNGDGLIGIDLDKCISTGGVIEAWAADFIQSLDSYTERSPSGRGIRIFIYGALPEAGRKKGRIEIYASKHYLTVTGDHVEGRRRTVENRGAAVLAIYEQVFGPRKVKENGNKNSSRPVLSLSDLELINQAMRAENGAKFTRLWNGDTSDYDGDESRADLAFCCMLAFWTGNQAEQIDRIFRHSGLMRDKWDRRDYRERTISAAIGATKEVFKAVNATKEVSNINGSYISSNGNSASTRMRPDKESKAILGTIRDGAGRSAEEDRSA